MRLQFSLSKLTSDFNLQESNDGSRRLKKNDIRGGLTQKLTFIKKTGGLLLPMVRE